MSNKVLVLTSRFFWAGGPNESPSLDLGCIAIEVSVVCHCTGTLVSMSQFPSADGSGMMTVSVSVSVLN